MCVFSAYAYVRTYVIRMYIQRTQTHSLSIGVTYVCTYVLSTWDYDTIMLDFCARVGTLVFMCDPVS